MIWNITVFCICRAAKAGPRVSFFFLRAFIRFPIIKFVERGWCESFTCVLTYSFCGTFEMSLTWAQLYWKSTHWTVIVSIVQSASARSQGQMRKKCHPWNMRSGLLKKMTVDACGDPCYNAGPKDTKSAQMPNDFSLIKAKLLDWVSE